MMKTSKALWLALALAVCTFTAGGVQAQESETKAPAIAEGAAADPHAGLAPAAADNSAALALIDKLEAASKSVKNYSANMKMVMEGPMGSGNTDVKIWRSSEGGVAKMRVESTMSQKFQGMEEAQSSSNVMVSDGTTMWQEVNMGGQVNVMKMAAQPDMLDEFNGIRQTLEQGAAKVLPSEDVDGKKCAVIEMTMGAADQAMKTTFWFDEATGIMVKNVSENPMMGKNTLTTSDIVVNGAVDASKFTYTAPEGVQVQDMTAGGM